jgi:hypothetical protein
VNASEDVDDILGEAFDYVANGFAGGFGIAGHLLASGRTEEDE